MELLSWIFFKLQHRAASAMLCELFLSRQGNSSCMLVLRRLTWAYSASRIVCDTLPSPHVTVAGWEFRPADLCLQMLEPRVVWCGPPAKKTNGLWPGFHHGPGNRPAYMQFAETCVDLDSSQSYGLEVW